MSRADIDAIRQVFIKDAPNDEFCKKIVSLISKEIDARLTKRIIDLEDKVSSLEGNMTCMQSEITQLRRDNLRLMETTDTQEQYHRNLNIRLYGIPSNADDRQSNIKHSVLNVFKEKMQLDIQESQIASCFRIKHKNSNTAVSAGPVLITFSDLNMRSKVLKNRKLLKGSQLVVKEDLTGVRAKILKCATEKFSRKNVWCNNGNIYVRFKGVVSKVSSMEHLNGLD